MPNRPTEWEKQPGILEVRNPERQTLPLVLASPHSGRRYPLDFVGSSRLGPHALRRSEDCFVDEIFGRATGRGAPLLAALFPRAYLDANREPFELDPEMFEDPLPDYVNSRSARVAAGLGTIARVVAQGQEIYGRRLRFAEALARINRLYHPYHAALTRLLEATQKSFGHCILVDCHSMPSAGGAGDHGGGAAKVDFVLGDCFGSACAPGLVAEATRFLTDCGYSVARNMPYAGGFTTRHYGRPRQGIHALQIEVNRSLYMDEVKLTRKPYLGVLAGQMAELVERLGRLDAGALVRAE